MGPAELVVEWLGERGYEVRAEPAEIIPWVLVGCPGQAYELTIQNFGRGIWLCGSGVWINPYVVGEEWVRLDLSDPEFFEQFGLILSEVRGV